MEMCTILRKNSYIIKSYIIDSSNTPALPKDYSSAHFKYSLNHGIHILFANHLKGHDHVVIFKKYIFPTILILLQTRL